MKGRGWLRLDPGETKNGEGRNFPFTARLRQIIEQQLEHTKALEKVTGRIIPWWFPNHSSIEYASRRWYAVSIGGCRSAGKCLRTGRELLPLEKAFSGIVEREFPDVRLGCDLVRTKAKLNALDKADNSLLIVAFAAFCSCRKVMHAVTLSPVISTTR